MKLQKQTDLYEHRQRSSDVVYVFAHLAAQIVQVALHSWELELLLVLPQ